MLSHAQVQKMSLGVWHVDSVRRYGSDFFCRIWVTRLSIQSNCTVILKLHVISLIILFNMIGRNMLRWIYRFFIKEKLDEKILELPKIRSEDQLVDSLTKAISSRIFSKYLSKLGMNISMHQLEEEC